MVLLTVGKSCVEVMSEWWTPAECQRTCMAASALSNSYTPCAVSNCDKLAWAKARARDWNQRGNSPRPSQTGTAPLITSVLISIVPEQACELRADPRHLLAYSPPQFELDCTRDIAMHSQVMSWRSC